MMNRTEATALKLPIDVPMIQQLLPHRYPFLLVDRVVELVKDEHIRALKNVTINEPFFGGHFPHRPVMPGVLMLEALAQTAALLSFESMGSEPDDDTVVYFVGIDGARFKRVVEPGDQLVLEARILRAKAGIYKYATRASVNGETAVEAELMCTMRKVG
jgi:3-hydroxyacyl-[acyl-carrier-protein] dehydratase